MLTIKVREKRGESSFHFWLDFLRHDGMQVVVSESFKEEQAAREGGRKGKGEERVICDISLKS